MPPPVIRKYTRNKAKAPAPAPPAPPPPVESFITQSIQVDENDEITDDVTYFVDEEGRYYYQPNSTETGIVALDPDTVGQQPPAQSAGELIVPDTDGGFTQTVTLVPSESANGEVSYVLVVAEENNQEDVVNLNINMNSEAGDALEEKQSEAGDVYTFDEDEEEEVDSDDDLPPPPGSTRKKYKTKTIFTCTFCSYNSHRRYLLLRHMKCHSEDRPHLCQVCERGFKTQASLLNHMNMHNGIKPHFCKHCKSTFTTSGELVRHVRYKHTHEKPHKCKECDYASVELSKLRRHVRCHTGERPYQCSHCTYASPDTFKLKRHMRTHTGERPYKCDMCTMAFTQSNSLKAHKLIHNVSQKPVYPCELCPTKCGRKTDLRIHVQKLHTSEYPLKCRRCGKSFPDRYSCKVHNKTHEGEKCFKCDLCPYASTTLRHLKSHVLKHTDEKPYECDHCDQTFRQKQLLRRHQNLYHNPNYVPRPPKEKTHTCHSCHRTFAHKGNLMRHMAVHDPESGHHERALALKLGRQKRVKYIDGSAFQHPFFSEIKSEGGNNKMVSGDASSSLKRGELVTVSDGDGQQYVVLQVIQLEDGTEQQVAVVAPDFHRANQIVEEGRGGEDTDEYGEEEALDDDDEEDEEEKKLLQEKIRQQQAAERSIKLEKDVDTCFGFDVSDEEAGELDDVVEVEEDVDDDDEEEEQEEEDEEEEVEAGSASSHASPSSRRRAVSKEPSRLPQQLLDGDEDEDDEDNEANYQLE